jgi:hypothetical protein
MMGVQAAEKAERRRRTNQQNQPDIFRPEMQIPAQDFVVAHRPDAGAKHCRAQPHQAEPQ